MPLTNKPRCFDGKTMTQWAWGCGGVRSNGGNATFQTC